MVDRKFNSVIVNVFFRDDEDVEKIKKAFLNLFPFDISEILIERKNRGFEEKIIRELNVELEKNAQIMLFLKDLSSKLVAEDKNKLVKEFDSRFSDEYFFFMRLDKDSLLNGHYVIVDSGNCFHIKFGILAYPKNKINALKNVEELLK